MSATTFTVRNEHPAHRVQTRRISTTNLAVREQEKNRVQTRRMSIASGAARERQENLGHRLREQQDHLGQRVQTRRMSTALCTIREQQEHPGRSSVGKLQSQEHPGQNIQTQAVSSFRKIFIQHIVRIRLFFIDVTRTGFVSYRRVSENICITSPF